MSVSFILDIYFTESELLKDLIWRKFSLFAGTTSLIFVSVLPSGKSTVCLFHSSHFDC